MKEAKSCIETKINITDVPHFYFVYLYLDLLLILLIILLLQFLILAHSPLSL